MCGIIGISSPPDMLSGTIAQGLFALQHRGQEAAGIALFNGQRLRVHRGSGLVHQVFASDPLAEIEAVGGIGHTRYSTTGESVSANAQPFIAVHRGHSYAIAHNGNLSNAYALRAALENAGAIFASTSDTEALLTMYVVAEGDPIQRIKSIASSLVGAYSVILLHDDLLVAFRDPMGFRPLSFGRLGDATVVASEDSAFALLGAQGIRDIKPGEIIVFKHGMEMDRGRIESDLPEAQCVFELIYFSRPDSVVFGQSSYAFRKACGRALARKEDAELDFVSPVPDSGQTAALGFSVESGIPLELSLIRNHYVGRSFIQPGQSSRREVVRNKILPLKQVIRGARMALVDDSIVRGTTSRLIVELLREFGAAEVHIRVASPRLTSPCFFGIDMPTREELLASSRDLDGIREFLRADSIRYLEVDDLKGILGPEADRFCYACFTGDYPPGSLPPEKPYRSIRK